jgi:ubiquinone/menaquinone biosynthesis C-methylase UbiE
MAEQDNDFDQIRAFYDDEYYGKQVCEASLPWHCRWVGRRLGQVDGAEVLDVACGKGEWLDFFRSRGAKISGIDLSKNAIAACLKRFPGGEFHCGPAENLPFADGRFDLVTCMGSLEHFLDKPGALREMVRVAKPGAKFLILVPNAGFLTRRLGLYKGTHQTKVREDVLELAQWQQIFEDAGLAVRKRWRDLHPISLSWVRQGNAISWPIRALQAMLLSLWPVHWQYQVYHYCIRTSR